MPKREIRMKTILILICSLFLLTSNTLAARRKEPKNKAGAVYYTHSGSQYTLISNATGNSISSNAAFIGVAFFYERLILSRFSAGLKFSSFLERSMALTLDNNKIDVLEKVTLFMLDFKAFFKDHTSSGLKPFIGVGYGQYNVSSSISVTASGSTTTQEDKQTTKVTIPVTSLNFGFDYFTDFGGIRLEGGLLTGNRSDLSNSDSDGYKAKYQASGATASVGVYSFF